MQNAAERSDASWLLSKSPPYHASRDGLERLWWAVLRQAALDLRYGHKQRGLDALEFFIETGVWLSWVLFAVPKNETRDEVAGLLLRRNQTMKSPHAITAR